VEESKEAQGKNPEKGNKSRLSDDDDFDGIYDEDALESKKPQAKQAKVPPQKKK